MGAVNRDWKGRWEALVGLEMALLSQGTHGRRREKVMQMDEWDDERDGRSCTGSAQGLPVPGSQPAKEKGKLEGAGGG